MRRKQKSGVTRAGCLYARLDVAQYVGMRSPTSERRTTHRESEVYSLRKKNFV